MSNLNEGILLVMKWISDNDSVSIEELKHKQADAYLTYDDDRRKESESKRAYAAYAAHEALFGAHVGQSLVADKWVDNYFDRTGENKLDYINALDAGSVINTHPDAVEEWNGNGLPPMNMPIELKHKKATKEWARPNFHEAILTFVGREIFVTDDGCRETIGHISDYDFRPLKTAQEIKKEEFIRRARSELSFDMKYSHVVDSVLEQLSDNGYLAPNEGN